MHAHPLFMLLSWCHKKYIFYKIIGGAFRGISAPALRPILGFHSALRSLFSSGSRAPTHLSAPALRPIFGSRSALGHYFLPAPPRVFFIMVLSNFTLLLHKCRVRLSKILEIGSMWCMYSMRITHIKYVIAIKSCAFISPKDHSINPDHFLINVGHFLTLVDRL